MEEEGPTYDHFLVGFTRQTEHQKSYLTQLGVVFDINQRMKKNRGKCKENYVDRDQRHHFQRGDKAFDLQSTILILMLCTKRFLTSQNKDHD